MDKPNSVKRKDTNHLYNKCKGNKKIWNHFQKYKNLIQKEYKEYTPLQHIKNLSLIITTQNYEIGSNID